MATLAATPEPAAASAPLRLELTRVIAAPRQRVFDAWTRPEIIRQWFGPEGYITPTVKTDPKVGGDYEIHMVGPDPSPSEPPRQAKVTGSYTRVNPYDLLQFTWSANWAPGETSMVTVHLRDVDGGTELRLVHDRFLSEQSRDGHEKGWTGALDKFSQMHFN